MSTRPVRTIRCLLLWMVLMVFRCGEVILTFSIRGNRVADSQEIRAAVCVEGGVIL